MFSLNIILNPLYKASKYTIPLSAKASNYKLSLYLLFNLYRLLYIPVKARLNLFIFPVRAILKGGSLSLGLAANTLNTDDSIVPPL
jgi:hypothetical protein